MKRVLNLVVLGCVVSIFSGISVYGLPKPSVVARIPFPFTIEHRQFPAGEYVIQIKDGGWLLIRSTGGNESTVVLTIPVHAKALDSRGALVFRRYGDRYFLGQVRVAARRLGARRFRHKMRLRWPRKRKLTSWF